MNTKQLLALKHEAQERHLAMGGGLYLEVGKLGPITKGTKLYCFYKVAGRRKRQGLGTFPEVSLAEATAARAKLRLDVKAGRDPRQEAIAARLDHQEANARTVEVEGRAWHATQARHEWEASYARQVLQRLERHVFPVIGRLAIHQVTRPQVMDLLAACKDTAGAFQADHVRQHTVCMFDYFVDRTWATSNVAFKLKKYTKTPAKTHQPSIDQCEPLRAALATFEASSASVSLKLFNRLLALTAVRPSEARLAEWSEFAVPGQWHIPAAHMKGRRGRKLAHTVLLSPEAVEVVEAARARSPAGALYVFPSDNWGKLKHAPLSRSSLAYRLQATLGKGRQTAHGYRGSFTTILKRRGHTKANLNMCLAHTNGDKVWDSYDHSVVLDYADTLAPIWREWAQLLLAGAPSAWRLAGLPAPVVPLALAA